MTTPHPDLPLLDRTYALLDQRDQSLEAVAEGAGVNPWWLRKFAQRPGGDHGVQKVQRVHDYLVARLTPAPTSSATSSGQSAA